jgi:hypothetical protein
LIGPVFGLVPLEAEGCHGKNITTVLTLRKASG